VAASNLVVRVGTALVGVPAILALLYLGPAWGVFVLVAAAGAVGAVELFQMTWKGDRVAQALGVVLTVAVSACVYFFTDQARVLLTVLLLVPLLGLLLPLWRLGDIQTGALRIGAACFGPLYVGAMLTTLALLRKEQPGTDGPGYVVVALAFAWLSDTGGYFAGRYFGKRKFYEAVSPKKTIAGSVGGLAGAVLGGVVAHFTILKSLPLLHAIALGLIAGFLGQLGDLGESLLKRSVGVKDSGAILPGHGGILDRVDALIVTSTVLYLYTRWLAG
jgi:phosphatidate cytidylyltransferase